MKDKLSRIGGRILNVLFALGTGIALGVFAFSYWLVDIFPLGSRRLLAFTLLIGLSGTAGYFFLFRWLRVQLAKFTTSERFQVIAWSLIIAPLLFFASTIQWQKPALHVNFFLPMHRLEIFIHPESAPEEISLTWFRTSLGDVSYDEFIYQGWERKDNRFFLCAPSEGSLFWTGRTGEEVEIIFQATGDGEASLLWDGREETLSFHAGQVRYSRSLKMPWYASREAVLFFGGVFFFFLSLALFTIIWPRRLAWKRSLKEKINPLSQSSFARREWGIILGLMLLALALRVFNLEALPPHIEEYAHMNAAKQILLGESMQNVYQRSMYTVTLPVTGFFSILGVHIWAARLAGVLFNVLAIIPLYLLMRKVNQSISILSSALYAASPWVIAMARNVREYAYYPFYFYLIVYGMILFLEEFPSAFSLSDWKKQLSPKLLALGFILLMPLFYAYYIDTASTFRVIVLFYFVFALFLLGRFNLRNKWNLLFLTGIIAGMIGLGISVVQTNASFVDITQSLERLSGEKIDTPLNYFFFNPSQQWYFNRLVIIPVLSIFSAWFWSISLRRKNYIPFFFSTLYIISMLAFLLFFTFDRGTRFYLHLQLWHILLLAVGFYSIWLLLKLILPRKNLATLILIIGILATFNMQQILLPQLYSASGYMPVTNQYHNNFDDLHSYLLQRADPGDVLMSSYYGRYAYFAGEPEFASIRSEQSWQIVLDEYSTGWIAVDQAHYWVYEDTLPLETFTMDAKKIEYIGEFGKDDSVDYLWHWSTILSP